MAPRIGMTFDLTGDGKTVLKGNYGLYWHNPGVGVGGSGNPNTAGKQATYTWNDINGDQRWQPGEEGAQTSASLVGSIGVDPNIKAPYTHEASALGRAPAERHDGHARRRSSTRPRTT